jgi:hypothetical protein
MLTDEQAAAIAAFYPTLTPALVREVVAAPPSAADGWQGWPAGAPAWQIADGVMVLLSRMERTKRARDLPLRALRNSAAVGSTRRPQHDSPAPRVSVSARRKGRHRPRASSQGRPCADTLRSDLQPA